MITLHRAAPSTGKMAQTLRRTTPQSQPLYKRPLVFPRLLLILVLLMMTEAHGKGTTFKENGFRNFLTCNPEDMQPNKINGEVIGTGNYLESSAICLSALHAGFLKTDGGEVQYTSSEGNEVVGTIRNRVVSSYGNIGNTYHFTGKKVVVDKNLNNGTTFVHNGYNGQSNELVLMCYSGNSITKWNHRQLKNVSDGRQPLRGTKKLKSNLHVFNCEGEQPWQDSRVVITLPPCTHTSKNYLCTQYTSIGATYTGSVGSSLTLDIHPVPQNDKITNLTVMQLPESRKGIHIIPLNKTFTSLEIGNDGIYIAGSSEDSYKKQGIYFEIMVRDCPDQRWGPNCANWCPDCQNGGQCHPSSGKCVCAPGFMGPTCSKGCDKGKFGSKCQLDCSLFLNSNCLGLTACVPYPRGCSCLPGYKGLECKEECEENEYGCGCSYQCNYCQWESCNSWDGQCRYGCKDDVPCSNKFPMDLPRLKQRPTVEDITDKSVKVKFKVLESEEVDILSYIVQYSEVSSQTWRTGQVVDHKGIDFSDWKTTLLSDLHPGSQYVIRVLVNTSRGFNDERSNKRILLSEPFITPCSELEESSSVFVYSSQRQARFLAEDETQNVNNCKLLINIQHFNDSSVFLGEGFTFQPTVDSLTPDTCYAVDVLIKNRDSKALTKTVQFCTLPDPPSKIKNFEVRPYAETVQITIEKPVGKVTHYIVSVKSDGQNTCRDVPAYVSKEFNFTVDQDPKEVYNLLPNQKYKICVNASNTGGTGEMDCKSFQTRPKAPENSLTITACTSHWCRVKANGNCSQYHSDNIKVNATLQGIRECDNHHWNQTVVASLVGYQFFQADFKNLNCAITYHVTFTPWNMGGKGQSVKTNFTKEYCAPPKPKIGIVTVSSASSLTVFWNDTCPSNGAIKEYKISHKLISSNYTRWTQNTITGKCHWNSFDRCYTIEKLRPGREYRIKIKADNGINSPWSEGVLEKLEETAPERPEDVFVIRDTTSLAFNITLPAQSNGKLQNCRVELLSGEDCIITELKEDFNFAYCLISGLRQGRKYTGHSRCDNSFEGEKFPIDTATLPIPPRLITNLELLPELSTDATFTISLPGLEHEGDGMSEVAVLLHNASSQANPNFEFKMFFKEEMERKASISSSNEDKGSRHKRNSESSEKCSVKEKRPVRVAARITETEQNQLASSKKFTVGDGKMYGKFCNAPLTKGSSYHVATVACTVLEGERMCTVSKLQLVVHVKQYAPISWAAVILPILLLLALLALVLILHKKGYLKKYLLPKGTQEQNQEDHICITEQEMRDRPRQKKAPFLPPPPVVPYAEKTQLPQHSGNQDTHGFTEIQSDPENLSSDYPWCLPSRKAPPFFDDDSAYVNIGQRIQRNEIESFLNNVIVKGMFDQFVNIPVICQEKSNNDGQNTNNRKKNRYRNNLPYDQTRVRLSIIDNDPYSDYINANHIQGCGGKLRYIATQGPKDEKVCTIGDFWRMAKEQNVKAIIMVANFVELDKVKVGEYFDPSRTLEWSGMYVSVIKQKRMPHYTVSTIKVQAVDGSAFEVKHYHYLSWPDHSVPEEARSLAYMIREIVQVHQKGSVVVHCSAGIGRTGTILFVLILHEMIETQNAIDPLRILAQMRHCRGRLLENENQFRFGLRLIDEVLFGERTLRDKGNVSADLNEILQQQSQAEYQRLCSLDSGLSYIIQKEKGLDSFNRNLKILPSDSSSVFLKILPNSTKSQYINAVRLQRTELTNALIATEYPMTSTMAAFWLMLYGENSPLLVIVNTFAPHDQDYPYLFPVLGDSLKVENITVILRETSQPLPFLLQHTIDLCCHGNVHTMLVYMFQSWPHEDELPSPLSNIIDLGELLLQIIHTSCGNPIVLCCADGVRGCGVVAGLLEILNSLINYEKVDVYRTVVSLKRDRKEFIPTQMQYDFLYQVANYYIQQNSTYENIEDIQQNSTYENIEDTIYENI
ncbi:uncharacterized protein LOC143040605 isoform X2 [Oratosquilla oratoria]|uniref:uncharacterized protein LOC143040605 isoform X2 n=1 Tax=Oratosquilla oratoria TaxID=337810 RepID=UPI003F7732F2